MSFNEEKWTNLSNRGGILLPGRTDVMEAEDSLRSYNRFLWSPQCDEMTRGCVMQPLEVFFMPLHFGVIAGALQRIWTWERRIICSSASAKWKNKLLVHFKSSVSVTFLLHAWAFSLFLIQSFHSLLSRLLNYSSCFHYLGLSLIYLCEYLIQD